MKVLFVVNMEDLGFEEPLGVSYLSAMCKMNNHSVYAVENSATKIEEKIESVKPDLLAASVLTPSFSYMYETVSRVKDRVDIPTVFGGPHITFFPEIVERKAIDYGFMGDGEDVFTEFLNLLEENKPIDKVDNLVVKNDRDGFTKNRLRPLVRDLDTLPFPDREVFRDYKQFYEADVRSVMASRGCPYTCSYCFNKEYHKLYDGLGPKVRVRSVDNVVDECVELKDIYDAKMIHFFDDIFPFRDDWIEEFADKYSRKVALPFLTNTRFSVCSETYVKSLSRAGCKTLLIGVETGDEELREKVLWRRMSNKMMIEKAKLIQSHGIKIYTQNLVGLPFGSLAKDIETAKLNIDLNADFANAYLCQPYPKTQIEKMAREAGLIDDSCEVGRSFYYPSALKVENKKDIEKLRVIFATIVNFPMLYKYLHLVLKMPMLPLRIMSSLLHGYKIRTVVLCYEMSMKVFAKNIKMFFVRRINSVFDREAEAK
jgi:anaerobic magnesium-protoporphyrin IX monomethyl ester cyclase